VLNISKETVYGVVNWGLMLIGLAGAVVYFSSTGTFQSPTQKLSQEQPKRAIPQEQPKINSKLSQEQPKIAVKASVQSPLPASSQTSIPKTATNAQTTAVVAGRPTERSTTPINRPQVKNGSLGNQHSPSSAPLESVGGFPEGF
jgi:hypothetical protein